MNEIPLRFNDSFNSRPKLTAGAYEMVFDMLPITVTIDAFRESLVF